MKGLEISVNEILEMLFFPSYVRFRQEFALNLNVTFCGDKTFNY